MNKELEIRIHGRGGQGTVIASLILARAAFRAGFHVQSFPEFGVERRGAPVAAFLRVSPQAINNRSKIYEPDHLLVLEPSYLSQASVVDGLKAQGMVCINMRQGGEFPSVLRRQLLNHGGSIFFIDAFSIASQLGIGHAGSPIVNTVMAGAYAKASQLAGFDDISQAIGETLGREQSPSNVAAAREGFERCQRLT